LAPLPFVGADVPVVATRKRRSPSGDNDTFVVVVPVNFTTVGTVSVNGVNAMTLAFYTAPPDGDAC
jgi:hypothetical protein